MVRNSGERRRRQSSHCFHSGSLRKRPMWPVLGTKTLLRWLEIPEFQTAYREARRAVFSQSIARLQQGTAAAATTLLKTMIDSSTPASVKVGAAEAISNHAAKAIEIEDIEARVSELE